MSALQLVTFAWDYCQKRTGYQLDVYWMCWVHCFHCWSNQNWRTLLTKQYWTSLMITEGFMKTKRERVQEIANEDLSRESWNNAICIEIYVSFVLLLDYLVLPKLTRSLRCNQGRWSKNSYSFRIPRKHKNSRKHDRKSGSKFGAFYGALAVFYSVRPFFIELMIESALSRVSLKIRMKKNVTEIKWWKMDMQYMLLASQCCVIPWKHFPFTSKWGQCNKNNFAMPNKSLCQNVSVWHTCNWRVECETVSNVCDELALNAKLLRIN